MVIYHNKETYPEHFIKTHWSIFVMLLTQKTTPINWQTIDNTEHQKENQLQHLKHSCRLSLVENENLSYNTHKKFHTSHWLHIH